MPETILLGHLLLLAAAGAVVAMFGFASQALRHKSELRGTPGYARGRTARRKALYALGIAIALAVACFTPLGGIVLVGAPR